ncbi:MAG: helix-turn-helix transcriptional regulator [Eubacteriales bacterium]|nr:helix-turn-helix transcriptional regulator [Eubacteriales bacterium]
MVDYSKLWIVMKQRNMTKTGLRLGAKLSTSTFAKLGKNEIVSLDVLVRLCLVLQCQLSDICTISELKEGAELE